MGKKYLVHLYYE